MKRLTTALAAALCLWSAAWPAAKKKEAAQKETKMSTLYKNAAKTIKDGGDYNARKNELLQALARPALKDRDKARVYYTVAGLDEALNGVENRKAYLKQPYDTAAFFSHLLRMYEDLRLCDSVDSRPGADGRVRRAYAGKASSLRLKHRRNLYNGSQYFLRKADYASAYTALDFYSDYAREARRGDVPPKVPYWAAVCGFMTNRPDRTLKYMARAMDAGDADTRPVLQEYKVRSYELLKNDSAWLASIKEGVAEFPEHDYFFVHLADYYYNKRMWAEGRALADTLIALDGGKALHWYAKSKVELAAGEYERCAACSDSVIARDSTFADAYYNKGISFLNLAVIAQERVPVAVGDAKGRAEREKVKGLYQAARPCMEAVRRLEPDNKDRWASPLYRIYLHLNLGKEFDEIDRLMHNQ